MFRIPWHIGLALLCLWASCGCRTSQPSRPRGAVRMSAQPVLVLPVLPVGQGLHEAGAELSLAIRRETTAVLGNRAIFAEDLAGLRNTLTTANLCRDGQLVLSEIATLAEVAGCGTVFVVVLVGADSYMPQSLTGNAVLVDAAGSGILAERVVRLDLADPDTVAAYQYYLQNVRGFRAGNLESDREDRVHTAMLSPIHFRRFAAYAMVADLFADENTPQPLHLRSGRNQRDQ